MDVDPRRLIARLAVAVMVADGRITPSEYDALERLDELGLGPLSGLAEDEIRNATCQPIDVRATCEGLAQATPEAAAVILSVLAEIAASDRAVTAAELDALRTVAQVLGLSAAETAHILSAAISEFGATMSADGGPRSDGMEERPRRERVTVIRRKDTEAVTSSPLDRPEVQHAYRVLGIDAAASRAHLDAAYLGLIDRYNPAKVADLGAEFAALAVRRLTEVTAAFEAVLDARLKSG